MESNNSFDLALQFFEKELKLTKRKLKIAATIDNWLGLAVIFLHFVIVAVAITVAVITYNLFTSGAPSMPNIFLGINSSVAWSIVSATFVALNLILGIIFQFYKVVTKYRFYSKIVREIDHKLIHFVNEKDYTAELLAKDVDDLVAQFDQKRQVKYCTLIKKYFKREI